MNPRFSLSLLRRPIKSSRAVISSDANQLLLAHLSFTRGKTCSPWETTWRNNILALSLHLLFGIMIWQVMKQQMVLILGSHGHSFTYITEVHRTQVPSISLPEIWQRIHQIPEVGAVNQGAFWGISYHPTEVSSWSDHLQSTCISIPWKPAKSQETICKVLGEYICHLIPCRYILCWIKLDYY